MPPRGTLPFVSSATLRDDVLAFEQKDPHGLNGFILLLHAGSPRKDPFASQLGRLCDELRARLRICPHRQALGPLDKFGQEERPPGPIAIVERSIARRLIDRSRRIAFEHFERHFAATQAPGLFLDRREQPPAHALAAVFGDHREIVQIQQRPRGECR